MASTSAQSASAVNRPATAARRPWVRLGVFGVALALILYLELKPDPSIAHVPLMPKALGAFFDRHDFLNNVLGFGALAAATHFAFSGWRPNSGRTVLVRAGWLGLGIFALECLQRALPARSFDWNDIWAGWLGVAAVSALWLTGRRPWRLPS